jgi:hypothetical protein
MYECGIWLAPEQDEEKQIHTNGYRREIARLFLELGFTFLALIGAVNLFHILFV